MFQFTMQKVKLFCFRFFLVAMPLLFLVFNLVYWLSYGSQFIFQEEAVHA